MNGLSAAQRAVDDDNMGAGAARAAAEALSEVAAKAAPLIEALAAADDPVQLAFSDDRALLVLLIDMMHRTTEGILTAERLHERQLSAAMIGQALTRQAYDAGWNDCLTARRGLRPVG